MCISSSAEEMQDQAAAVTSAIEFGVENGLWPCFVWQGRYNQCLNWRLGTDKTVTSKLLLLKLLLNFRVFWLLHLGNRVNELNNR